MKEPRHDDERLAALLAGRLEGPERDELLAHLSTADEDYEVFANTAAILREMDEEDAQAAEAGLPVADPPPRPEALPPSMTKRAQGWRRSPRWAIPLALVGLVVLTTFVLLRGGSTQAGPLQFAANLEIAGAAPAEWDEVTWRGAVRGGGAAGSDPASAAQAGASLVRLAIAVETGDSASTVDLARRMVALFDPQGGNALREIETRAGAPAAELEPLLEQATERLEARLDRHALRLGAWTEAARLAALTRDEAFFRSDDSRAMLRRAEERTADDPEARDALDRVRAALDAEGARDWAALHESLTDLLGALGAERR